MNMQTDLCFVFEFKGVNHSLRFITTNQVIPIVGDDVNLNSKYLTTTASLRTDLGVRFNKLTLLITGRVVYLTDTISTVVMDCNVMSFELA